MPENGEPVTRREHAQSWEHHERLHQDHVGAHMREHEMTNTAIKKAEEATERAILAAKEANDRRFDGVNEFRQTLSDAATRFSTKDALTALEKSLENKINEKSDANRERINKLEKDSANMTGRLWSMGVGLGLLVIVLQFAIPLIRQ